MRLGQGHGGAGVIDMGARALKKVEEVGGGAETGWSSNKERCAAGVRRECCRAQRKSRTLAAATRSRSGGGEAKAPINFSAFSSHLVP